MAAGEAALLELGTVETSPEERRHSRIGAL